MLVRDWERLIADEQYWMRKHYTKGRGGKPIRAVVIHHNAANLTLRQIYDVWQIRQASAHYQVDANGDIGQYVRDRDTAWAVGGGRNSDTISVEHANARFAPAWTVSDATLDNGAHLVAALCHKYQLGRPQWGVNVFPHRAFYPTACPGALAGSQNTAYMARAEYWYDQMTKNRGKEEEMTPEQEAKLDWIFNNLKVSGQPFGYPQATHNAVGELIKRLTALEEKLEKIRLTTGTVSTADIASRLEIVEKGGK